MSESVPTHTPLWLQGRTARDLMTASPLCIPVDATLEQAAFALQRFSAMPVIDETERCIGVLSRSDLATALSRPEPVVTPLTLEVRADDEDSPSELTYVPTLNRIRDIMTSHVVTVGLNASVALILEALQLKQIGRLFVVDEQERLQGVISHTDLIARLRVAVASFPT